MKRSLSLIVYSWEISVDDPVNQDVYLSSCIKKKKLQFVKCNNKSNKFMHWDMISIWKYR